MKHFSAVLLALLAAAGLVWLALRPSAPERGGARRERIERIEAEGLAWVERNEATGRIRLRVEADTALRDGDVTTTGKIRAWLHPETGPAPPTEITAEGGRLRSTGREDPSIEEVVFAGGTEVVLSDGLRVRGSGIRWSRAQARIESEDPIRMEGDAGGWLTGEGFTLDPATRIVRLRGVRGAWPM